jgi:tagatose-1,6-bisphosphate aldolase
MSGGHYNYAYASVRNMAELVEEEAGTIATYENTCDEYRVPREDLREVNDRLRFARVLNANAEAMRTLEWYDSGDSDDWNQVRQAFNAIIDSCKDK